MSYCNPTVESSSSAHPQDFLLRGQPLLLKEVSSVARGRCQIAIDEDPTVLERLRQAENLVHRAVEQEWRVYGVTTGFGSMAEVPVPAELAAASQANLLAFLTTGAGRPVERQHVRAAMLLRGNMLLRGIGARLEIIKRLVTFLNADAIPVVGRLGSIGASGDLVPLSTVARAVTGQGACRVMLRGRQIDGREALAELGLEPLALIPKEALAIVNGTSFSAGIAVNCVYESRIFLAMTLAIHAMMFRALSGHEEPLLPFVHECKPHPGQVWTANVFRRLLELSPDGKAKEWEPRAHLQDRYSLRCLPQYLGPIVEGIARVTRVVEVEMNAVTDNPLIDADGQKFYQSGNFLGQYLGIAMDDLRRFLGLLAKHLDVQIAQLVAPEFSHGLPASLHGNGDCTLNMGLKGLQITGNSIMPLLTYFGNPLVEHSPTHAEQFNQNVNGLSWGAADLATQSVELFRQYVAVSLIFAVQAVDLRAHLVKGHYDGRVLLGAPVVPLYDAVYDTVGCQAGAASPLIFDDADQSLESYLERLSICIGDEGQVVAAVAPIVDSLAEVEPGC